jgi:protein-S-isoprenylcysteine O-methyltransferase Ste14
MNFSATRFEFRWRFFIIAAIFWAGFACYRFDPVNAGSAVRSALGGGFDVRWVFWLAAAAAAANALLRTWAAAYLRTEIVQAASLHSDRLVADGPYRHLRNPLYLGTNLLAVGLGLAASRLGFLVIAGGVIGFTFRLILREEDAFGARGDEGYAAYRRAVPRLVPSLLPRVPAAGSVPHWGQAWLGESPMWCFAAGTAAFAATLSVHLLLAGIGAAFAAYGIVFAFLRNKRSAAA